MRGELLILTELQKRGINIKGKAYRTLKRRYIINNDNIIIIKEKNVKQKMQLKAQRIRRHEKRNIAWRCKDVFYREIGERTITVDDAPLIEEFKGFWKDIMSEGKRFNKQAEWMK